MKREARPPDEAILSSRLIDRTIRPRFDNRIRNEMQVVSTVLSFDAINDPDILALFGASLALMISDIPFAGPIAGVRVGRINGKLIINPTYEERKTSDFDIVVAGTLHKINMIEAGINVVSEKEVAEAIEFGFKEFKKLIDFQKKISAEVGKEKRILDLPSGNEELTKKVSDFVTPLLEKALYTSDKKEYVEGSHRTEDELKEYLKSEYKNNPDLIAILKDSSVLFDKEIDRIVHKNILDSNKRPDGRKLDQLREVTADVGILPQTHGTGLFNRGSTQTLSILTLAAPGMEQWVETMEIELTKRRFMHHYVFPPFSVGEVGRIGFTGRRDIGHGALAERALIPLLPSKEDFPYTIRVVSEILSSNGSSSMASVCGSSLALMDGGVPMKSIAAGIAMGLMSDEKGKKYKILTDIQGPEDHHGDMDMKVAGTKEGITAIQMDVKVEGIDNNIVIETLEQARKARLKIIDIMSARIAEHRKELSPLAPRIKSMNIDPNKIRVVIGPQGKMINEIIEKIGVDIDIEDDGLIFITSLRGEENINKAIKWIEDITFEAKPGDKFEGKVTRLFDFGAMVEYISGKEGLVHVSEISENRVRRPSDVLKPGQKVRVMVKNIDEMGRINLTMKIR